MSESKDTTFALNVRRKPSDSSAHPRAANYTNVGVAQGIAYLDFGFIEPAMLAAITKTAKDGQVAPKGLDGHLVTRVADGCERIGEVAAADSASVGGIAGGAAAEAKIITAREARWWG